MLLQELWEYWKLSKLIFMLSSSLQVMNQPTVYEEPDRKRPCVAPWDASLGMLAM